MFRIFLGHSNCNQNVRAVFRSSPVTEGNPKHPQSTSLSNSMLSMKYVSPLPGTSTTSRSKVRGEISHVDTWKWGKNIIKLELIGPGGLISA